MTKVMFPQKKMLAILECDEGRIVEDTVESHSRWSVGHKLIFEYDGRLFLTGYSVGATEQQYESPWEDMDEVECTEVEAYQRTITDYRDKED